MSTVEVEKYREVIDLIAKRSGIDVEKLDQNTVIKKIQNFMNMSGLNNVGELIKIINIDTCNRVFDNLISDLTIGETYFFRYKQQFEYLKENYLTQMHKSGNGIFRAWSAACSTGEEAYSIAMTALSSFGTDATIEVLASDINRSFIDTARTGRYRMWSTREGVPVWAKNYIVQNRDAHVTVVNEVKKLVTFDCVNLVTDQFVFSKFDLSGLDVIFCRNVLMYLEPDVARSVVKKLVRVLKDEGLLFVAPVEFPYPFFDELEQCTMPNGDGFFKKKKGIPVVTKSTIKNIKTEPSYDTDPQFLISDIMFYANKGDYAAALKLIDSSPDRLEVDYFLNYYKGLILNSLAKREEALLFLKRSIYLNSSFIMGHFHLAVLYKETGDSANMKRHLKIVTELTKDKNSLEEIELSGGLTVGRMNNFVQKMLTEVKR